MGVKEDGIPPPEPAKMAPLFIQEGAASPLLKRKGKLCCLCCSAAVSVFILLAVIFTILAFTVFKVRKPELQVTEVEIDDFQFGFRVSQIIPSVNLTMAVAVAARNPNRLGFRYKNGTTSMFYRGIEFGVAPIPAGYIGAQATENVKTSVKIQADKLLENPISLLSDFAAGTVPVDTETQLSGKSIVEPIPGTAHMAKFEFRVVPVNFAVYYSGIESGGVPIPAGYIGALVTKNVKTLAKIEADKLLGNPVSHLCYFVGGHCLG